MRRLLAGIIVGLLATGAGALVMAPPAAACGIYFSADEIPAGAAYTAYFEDDGGDGYWVYVVAPEPGTYCGA